MKIKKNFTLDEENLNWLEHKHRNNLSEGINQLLADARIKDGEVHIIIEEAESEYFRSYEKYLRVTEKLTHMIREGNKNEREAAEKLLADQKHKKEEGLEKLNNLLALMKSSKVWKKFERWLEEDKGRSVKDLCEWAGKFQELEVRVGAIQIREMLMEGLLENKK